MQVLSRLKVPIALALAVAVAVIVLKTAAWWWTDTSIQWLPADREAALVIH